MDTRVYDWKDVANAQFDKALSLALLVLLFCIVVTPKVDVAKQKFSLEQMQAIDLPPEQREQIKPPEVIVKPIEITISDEIAGDDSDMQLQELAMKKMEDDLKQVVIPKSTSDERPFEFVPYEDAPVPIVMKSPEYTEFMKRSGIQRTVMLEVDVYRDGSVGNIVVKKSLLAGTGGTDEAAINAVKKWKFQPGKSGGKAVDTTVIIPIEFTLTRN